MLPYDNTSAVLISSRAVSISRRSESDKCGAKRGAKADSCPGTRTKVKAMQVSLGFKEAIGTVEHAVQLSLWFRVASMSLFLLR